jgi:hypothetical protein
MEGDQWSSKKERIVEKEVCVPPEDLLTVAHGARYLGGQWMRTRDRGEPSGGTASSNFQRLFTPSPFTDPGRHYSYPYSRLMGGVR